MPGLAPSWPTIRRHPSPSIRAAAIETVKTSRALGLWVSGSLSKPPPPPSRHLPLHPLHLHPPIHLSSPFNPFPSHPIHPNPSIPAQAAQPSSSHSSTPPRLHALPPSSIRRRGALKRVKTPTAQPQPSSSRPLPPPAATAAGALDPVFPIHPIHPSHLRLSIPSSPSSSTSPPLTLSLSRRVASLQRVDNRTRANILLGLRLSSLGRQHRGAAQRALGSIFCGDPRTRCAQLAPSSSSSLPSSSRNQSVAPSRAAVALVYL